MISCSFFSLICTWCFLLVGPVNTQSNVLAVVNIKLPDYPNNILRVPEYESDATISVELSEAAQTNQVEVTCETLSTPQKSTKVSFVKTTLPVGSRDGSVQLSIISAGLIAKVQCSAHSQNDGVQFQPSTSAGTPGYIQVTKRPTVSLCSDVIVLPQNTSFTRSVEVMFSENVTTDPVNVSCSVVAPVKANSSPMKLQFFTRSVLVNTVKTKVLYEVVSAGDPVVVSCHAASDSATTLARNLQYTTESSQGDSAVFTFQVPQATFLPALIQSLGQTTVERTVSFLVLEEPATNQIVFQCSMVVHDPATPPICTPATGAGSTQPTTVDLASVTVSLVTTNMTFETGDYYKPLVINVNGTNTERDQKLLDVTCCRKNTDPKYYKLETTMSLWIDIFPSVQFVWSNVSEGSPSTKFSQFDFLCPCDLKSSRCDIGCCCDQDCSVFEKQSSSCIPGLFGGSTSQDVALQYACQQTATLPADSSNYHALLCIITDNNPFLGMLYQSPSPVTDGVQFDSVSSAALGSAYGFAENEDRNSYVIENAASSSGYKDGTIVQTDSGFLTIPQTIAGAGACTEDGPVVFLRDSDTWCSVQFSETSCGASSQWSALKYLVPRDPGRPYCATTPQVLSVSSADNSSAVPTQVTYYCINDTSNFVTSVGENWIPFDELQRSSIFDTTSDDSLANDGLSRCMFDDDITKPPAPWYNASTQTCHNVVLRVQYTVYWQGVSIVQLRARVIMGDVIGSATTMSAGKVDVLVGQRFSVTFVHLKDVMKSQLPFNDVILRRRSGNPGYLTGSKILVKLVEEDGASNLTTTTNEAWGELGLWSSSTTGRCVAGKTSHMSFGVNTFTGCLVQLSLNDLANCSKVRETILSNQESLIKATHVSKRGDTVQLNITDDWVPLLRPSSPLTNVTLNETFGSCDGVPSGLRYEVLIKDAGRVQGVRQLEIIGVRYRYTLQTWSFRCVAHNCKSCNLTTDDGNNTNTSCKDSVQAFEVTSSVSFIPVVEVQRLKRSADTTNTCYQDSCAAELLYPVTSSYDGELREVAIAYGLILVALILFVISLTTSCVPNIRQLMFQ